MKALKIYIPEGGQVETRRMQLSDAATHVAANDQLLGEAQLLQEFAAADEIPQKLSGMKLESNGTDEFGEYYRYVADCDPTAPPSSPPPPRPRPKMSTDDKRKRHRISAAKQREKNREKYNAYHRELRRRKRASKFDD